MTENPTFLLNCPFCNGKAELEDIYTGRYEYFVKCTKCKVEQGKLYKGKQAAMNAWNRRVKV